MKKFKQLLSLLLVAALLTSSLVFGVSAKDNSVVTSVDTLSQALDVLAQEDVAADGACKEEYVLEHLSEVLSERTDLDVLDVYAVNQDLSSG